MANRLPGVPRWTCRKCGAKVDGAKYPCVEEYHCPCLRRTRPTPCSVDTCPWSPMTTECAKCKETP